MRLNNEEIRLLTRTASRRAALRRRVRTTAVRRVRTAGGRAGLTAWARATTRTLPSGPAPS